MSLFSWLLAALLHARGSRHAGRISGRHSVHSLSGIERVLYLHVRETFRMFPSADGNSCGKIQVERRPVNVTPGLLRSHPSDRIVWSVLSRLDKTKSSSCGVAEGPLELLSSLRSRARERVGESPTMRQGVPRVATESGSVSEGRRIYPDPLYLNTMRIPLEGTTCILTNVQMPAVSRCPILYGIVVVVVIVVGASGIAKFLNYRCSGTSTCREGHVDRNCARNEGQKNEETGVEGPRRNELGRYLRIHEAHNLRGTSTGSVIPVSLVKYNG